jgi:hypothetical protein
MRPAARLVGILGPFWATVLCGLQRGCSRVYKGIEMNYAMLDAVTNEEMPRTRATDALVKQLLVEWGIDPSKECGPLAVPDNAGTDGVEIFLFINRPACL